MIHHYVVTLEEETFLINGIVNKKLLRKSNYLMTLDEKVIEQPLCQIVKIILSWIMNLSLDLRVNVLQSPIVYQTRDVI